MKRIAEGAEASIYSTGTSIIKQRHRKGYRIKELDERLRAFRTKREAKVMERLHEIGVAVPQLDDISGKTLTMELIKGKKLRDVLTKRNCRKLCRQVGGMVGKMHEHNIIHGDLTTSNMIYKGRITLIDFGLSFFSEKTEDKAVDVHLFKQALGSYHPEISSTCFSSFVRGYSNGKNKVVLQRLVKVEQRGRYKKK